jgi:hypothetical protein
MEVHVFLQLERETNKLRASDRGGYGVFYAFKMPKMYWR